jgi:SNF2 family DNA or RNA helicase
MTIELYPFQQKAVDKLSGPFASRLIGDEMGLGKTIEGIVVDYKLRLATRRPAGDARRRRTLVLAPLSVHDHWQKHIKMVWPTAKVYVYESQYQPAEARRRFALALRQNYSYYVIHYEGIRAKDLLPKLRTVDWFDIIADECHRIKNKKAQQTRALKSLKTRYKMGLSGTPADNKPQDLWSVLNWMWPQVYTSFWKYVQTYCEVALEQSHGSTFRKIVGVNKENIPYLLKEMEPYYVRRLKVDVLKELPPKTYTDIWVDLSPKQRKAYNSMRKDMLAWVGEHEDQVLSAPVAIAQLVRLQQFALASAEIAYKTVRLKTGEAEQRRVVTLSDPSAKLDALEEYVADNPTEQFVIFSQFRTMVDLAARRLEANKVSVGRYTGAITDQQTRNATVEAFQRGDLHCFAGTIAAGGESITLTAASTVVFTDRHWSPAKNNQAEDRLHRVGQKNAVQVIDLMARNTIDLGRRQVIASKWTTLKYLLGDTVDLDEYAKRIRKEAA